MFGHSLCCVVHAEELELVLFVLYMNIRFECKIEKDRATNTFDTTWMVLMQQTLSSYTPPSISRVAQFERVCCTTS